MLTLIKILPLCHLVILGGTRFCSTFFSNHAQATILISFQFRMRQTDTEMVQEVTSVEVADVEYTITRQTTSIEHKRDAVTGGDQMIWESRSVTTTTKQATKTKRKRRVLHFVTSPLQATLDELRPWRYVEADFKAGKSAYASFQRTRRKDDLETAVDHYKRAYSNSNEEHDQFPFIINAYAYSLLKFNPLYGSGENQWMDVIKLYNEVLRIWDKESPRPLQYSSTLINLGNSYLYHYEQTKRPDAAQLAIETFDRVWDYGGVEDWIRAECLIGSARAISMSYEIDSRVEEGDLEKVIGDLKEASEEPHWSHSLQARYFQTLAECHSRRHRRHPERLDDLNEAIDCNKKSMELRQLEGDPVTLHNLALSYLTRYTTTNQEGDLRSAETAAQNAKKYAAKGSNQRAQIQALQCTIELHVHNIGSIG